MKIETLALYCDIIRFKNFTKAAEKNGLSQSRASQALKMLEEQFDTQLIERTQRPWKLTKEGRILYEESIEIVSKYMDTVERVKKADSFSSITLGAIYSVAIKYSSLFIKNS